MELNYLEKPADIGRNEPCRCGSGKKYKRCCMDKELSHRHDILKTMSVHPMADQIKVRAEAPFMHPWENPFYIGVGKYAPNKESLKAAESVASVTESVASAVEDKLEPVPDTRPERMIQSK
jgi:hypothetical protein